ncbi:MAG: hypothetical protein IJY67_05665 [Paludibacteraceae bacterium]|nr:hypothetical protein [Paludibacteraceae bacterium]
MKKDLHRLIALFAIMFFSSSIFAQDFGSVLNESFENGIPEDWIQENVVNNQMWSVEGGDLTRPGGAFDGVKRLAFRNTTNVTTKAKTRLILPVMDISNLYQPIVIFAHAQDKWTNDFDTLKVLYRSAPEKEWVELKVFDESISKWQIDTIRLISPSKTYQLAFEGTDNLGRGIVLDDIEIRSTPNCVDPYSLFVSDVANDSFKFVWLGAFDAVAFNLKVSTFELTKEQLVDKNFKADVLDTAIIEWEYKLDGLLPATTYYWYIQSQCEDEISNWVSSQAKTSNVLELPYYEKFGSQYTAGYVTYLTDWYLFASETKPFINTNNAGDKFYTSVDNSYVLCFNGEASSAATSAIPGGRYCYAALPQINIPSLDALQLSFWTIRSNPYVSERFSIIVGVMTDPTVKGSFVPVDTIDITSINDYVECVVSFENYKGEGKYITFMSDFAESNIFIMDNLSVTYRPEIVKVLFDIDIPSATSLKFNFKQQYDKYEVVVSNKKIESSLLDSSTDVVRREILNNGLVDGLNAGLEYFVYARAIKGTEKGEWSNAVRIRMPGKAEVYPYMLDLSINQSDATTYYYSQIGNFIDTYNYLVPEIIVHTNSPFHPHTNYGELYLQSVIARKSSMTAVLPEIIDKNTRISFYATNRVGEWIANDYGCTFYVGVMSDANDPSTFVAIDTVTVGKKYEYFVYELDKYNVEGKFFALKIDEAHYYGQSNVGDLNNVYIKDVKYDFIPTCKYPTNIKVESALNNPSQVTISWDANNVSKWNVRISEVEYDRDSLAIDTFDYKYVYNDIVNTNSVVISDLKFPEVTYYYWIQPICGDEVGEWLPAYKFNTGCYHKHPIPYYENFDKEAYSTSNTEPEFTVPCMYSTRFREESQFEVFGEKDTFYPYVTSTQAINEKSLCLTRREAWGGADSYVALPKMDSPIKNLQISFKMYVTNVTHTVSVGVMENPFDNANINVVSVIRPKVVNEWIEYIVTFDDYSGKGEYIALTTNNLSAKSVELYIDDIEVNYKSTCERPENVGLVDFNDSTITIGWNDLSATSYCVMLARQRLDKEQLTEPVVNDTIFKIDTVKTNPVTITGLEENTEFYVQTICDGSVSYWSNPLRVRTSCKILTVGEFGIESFDSYGTGWGMYPSCFIVGNLTSDFEGCIPHCFDAYHHSGGASLRITSNTIYNGAYAIVPPLNISDISMLKVKFWGSVDPTNNPYVSKNSIIVGVITDPSDLSTFVPVETVKLSDNCPVEVYLDSYKGDVNGEKGKCVMFLSEFDGPNDIFIDDLEFDTIKTCETIFEIENIKDVSVDIKFNSQSTSYQLKYATEMCNVEILNKDSLPLINVTQGNTATISNLNPNTNYYLYARQMCNGSYGDWSNVKLVTTSCKMLVTLPFSDNFDNQPFESGQPMCWNVFYETADYPKLLSAYYNTPSRSVYVYSNKSGAESYLVTQEIDVDDLSKCQVGFQMRPNTTGKNRSIGLVLLVILSILLRHLCL